MINSSSFTPVCKEHYKLIHQKINLSLEYMSHLQKTIIIYLKRACLMTTITLAPWSNVTPWIFNFLNDVIVSSIFKFGICFLLQLFIGSYLKITICTINILAMYETGREMVQESNNLITVFVAMIRYFFDHRIQEVSLVNLALIGAWLYPEHLISHLGYFNEQLLPQPDSELLVF